MNIDKASDTRVVVKDVPYVEPLELGEVVEIPRLSPDAKFVVVAIRTNKYNVARLGGDGGRYYRSLDRSQLSKVDIAGWTMS